MTLCVFRGRGLLSPHEPAAPRATLTLAEIPADGERLLEQLSAGGAILVESDGGEGFLGAFTRDPAVLGDAQLAQLIETGAIPPLERLLDAPSDAPAA